jgi:hypothetical protein
MEAGRNVEDALPCLGRSDVLNPKVPAVCGKKYSVIFD